MHLDGALTLSKTTLIIMTLSIIDVNIMLSIDCHYAECLILNCHAEYRYVECHYVESCCTYWMACLYAKLDRFMKVFIQDLCDVYSMIRFDKKT
jgi:hypothetical protein